MVKYLLVYTHSLVVKYIADTHYFSVGAARGGIAKMEAHDDGIFRISCMRNY